MAPLPGRYLEGFDECGALPPDARTYPLTRSHNGGRWHETVHGCAELCRRPPGHVGRHRNMVREWVDPGPPARYTFAVSDQGK